MAEVPANPQAGESSDPTVEDVVRLCAALNASGARYLLIGGWAVNYWLPDERRLTRDIDFLVDPSPDNVRKLKDALSVLPDRAVLEIADEDVGQYLVVRVADEVVVDLMASACGRGAV